MSSWIILAGVILLLIGLLLRFAPGMINWFGSLPGDINIKSENSRVFIPITSMILLSVILTLIINIVKRWM